MKKLLCFLMTGLMGVSSISGLIYADAIEESEANVQEQNGEITFRDIPWGTTYGDVLVNYNEFNVESNPYITNYLLAPINEESKIYIYANGYSVADNDKAGFTASAGDYEKAVCSVAGYEVKTVDYGFIFSTDASSGYVDDDANNAKLYYAEYWFFDMNDATAMVEDLINKMSSLYGEIKDSAKETYSAGDEEMYYMWEDIAGNWIVLKHGIKADDSDSVIIDYCCGQIFNWMDELTEAYTKGEADNFIASSSTDGL